MQGLSKYQTLVYPEFPLAMSTELSMRMKTVLVIYRLHVDSRVYNRDNMHSCGHRIQPPVSFGMGSPRICFQRSSSEAIAAQEALCELNA